MDAGDLLLTADGATVEAGTLLWDTAHIAPAFVRERAAYRRGRQPIRTQSRSLR